MRHILPFHFSLAAIKITFPMAPMVTYLLPFNPVDSYLTRCSSENFVLATVSGNESAISYGIPVVTIPLLDLLIFY